MRIFAKLGVFSLLFALPFSVLAFGKNSFEYPQIQSVYQNAVNLENARLAKIPNLATADRARLIKAENRLISSLSVLQTAYRSGDTTKIRKASVTAKSAGSFFSFTLKSLKNEAKKPGASSSAASSSPSNPTSSSNSSSDSVSVLYYADSFNGGHTSL